MSPDSWDFFSQKNRFFGNAIPIIRYTLGLDVSNNENWSFKWKSKIGKKTEILLRPQAIF